MQTGRFLVSPATESRCWPERRSKMTKGGTLFIEQNCASLQQTLLFMQNSGTAGICWSWGAIQIPLSLRFLSEEVTPPPATSHCYKQGGTPQSQYPLAHSRRADTWHALDPADSSPQIDVTTEKCWGSSDFSSDRDELVKSLSCQHTGTVLLPTLSQTPVHSGSYWLTLQSFCFKKARGCWQTKNSTNMMGRSLLDFGSQEEAELTNPCSG